MVFLTQCSRGARHAARVGAYLERFAATTEDSFESELIVGELFANTVEHAPGIVEPSIAWADERALLTVCDTGPG